MINIESIKKILQKGLDNSEKEDEYEAQYRVLSITVNVILDILNDKELDNGIPNCVQPEALKTK